MSIVRVTGLGVQVDVHLDGASEVLSDRLAHAWSRCVDLPASRTGSPVTAVLTGPGVHPGESDVAAPDPDILLTRITQAVTGRVIEAQVGNLLMLHAGAVSDPGSGASVVFVAAGGTGKTTLARTLGVRFGYLTDETVGIDRIGAIHPYPKPLSIRTGGSVTHKDEVSPDDLGLAHAHPDPHVARIILLSRRNHHKAMDVEEVSLLDAIAALAPETSSLSSLERGLSFCADLLARTGPVLRVRYSEASSLGALFDDVIGEVR